MQPLAGLIDPSSGLNLTNVMAINNNGQILAQLTVGEVLLTPVPEPGAVSPWGDDSRSNSDAQTLIPLHCAICAA